MSIRYVDDLYPRTNPRDGARIRRIEKPSLAHYEGVRNGTGSGKITVRGFGADAAAIDPRGLQLIRKVRIDTDVLDGSTLSGRGELVIGGYWLEQGDFEALDRMRLRRLSFGGAGMLAYLDREHHWSHSYLSEVNPSFGTMDPFDGKWRWWNQGDWAGGNFLGAILWRGLMEGLAHRIGATYTHRHATPGEFGQTFTDSHADDKLETAISFVTLGFDQFVDSSGNPWTVPSGEFESPVGETLYTFITRLMAAGLYIELDPVTFVLRAWEVANHGRNRTGLAWGANVVRFNPPPPPSTDTAAGNILSELKRAVRPLMRATALLTGGQDVYGLATQAGDVPWHRFHADDAADPAALGAVATRQLGARNDAGDTVQVQGKVGNDPANGYYLPFEHAQLDDLGTLHSGTATWDWNEAAYPVAKIAIDSRRSGAPVVFYHLGASYHATTDRRFEGGAGVGRHTHPPNQRLCDPAVIGVEDQVLYDLTFDAGRPTVAVYPSGTALWPTGEFLSDTNPVAQGGSGLRVAWGGSAVDHGPCSPTLPATPGVTYRWHLWVTSTHLRSLMQVQFFGSDNSLLSTNVLTPSVPAAWETWYEYTADFTAPVGAAYQTLHAAEGWGGGVAGAYDTVTITALTGSESSNPLNGTSNRARRCDSTEHEILARDPTVNDDVTAGYPRRTIWHNSSSGATFISTASTDGAAVWVLIGGTNLSGIDFLVGTAQAGLSAEIVVGTAPGGELGGTWAAPTVDPTHSGSAHNSLDYLRDRGGGEDLVQAHGNAGATETIDPEQGNWHALTLNASLTLTLTNPAAGVGATLLLELTQDVTGGRTLTLPASVADRVDLEAAYDTTADTTSFLLLWTRNTGSTWYGAWVGGGTAVGALDDLSDVTITSATTLDRLHYNGTAWVNTAAIWRPLMDGAGYVITDGGSGEAIMALS